MNTNIVSSLIAAQLYSETHTPGTSRSIAQPVLKTGPRAPHTRQGSLVAFTMAGAMALALSGCDSAQQTPGTYIAPPKGLTPNDAVVVGSNDAPTTNAYVHPVGPGGGGNFITRGYYPVYNQPGYYYRPAPGTTMQLMTVRESFASDSDSDGEGGISRGGFGGGEGGEGGHGGGGGGE